MSALGDAAANVYDRLVHGGLADLRTTPARIVHEQRQCTVFRYLPPEGARPAGRPVLLVPPLAAPSVCFDLRRGHSLAEHLLRGGRPTYLVEYGPIAWSDRDLGLEHWLDVVLPTAIRVASADAGGEPVRLVGWSLGGIMAVLAAAADPSLPVAGVAAVGSPFDFHRVRLFAPVRAIENLTGGAILTSVYRLLGGAPSPLVRRAFRLTSLDKELTKPVAVLTHLHDRDFLAQLEAVDRLMDSMHAYPGRSFGQLYHRFFRVNDLADGHLTLAPGREIDLADLRAPLLSVAGEDDVLAPRAAVHHVASLVPNAAAVRLTTAPGGHLGVLAGRGARDTTWRAIDAFLDGPAGPVHERLRREDPAGVP